MALEPARVLELEPQLEPELEMIRNICGSRTNRHRQNSRNLMQPNHKCRWVLAQVWVKALVLAENLGLARERLIRSSAHNMLSRHPRRHHNLSRPNHSHTVVEGEVGPVMFRTRCPHSLRCTAFH